MMSGILGKEPLRVYAIAMFLAWEDVMKAAAYATLKVPLRDLGWCQELGLLSAEDYHKLLQWRFACQDAVGHVLDTGDYPSSDHDARAARRLLGETFKVTGCPGSGALINDTTKANVFQTNPKQSSSKLYKALERLGEEIDEALSKVRIT